MQVEQAGHVAGLRAVGKTVTGEQVSEFAASPDGSKVAYAQQGCAEASSAALNSTMRSQRDCSMELGEC